MRRNLVIAVLGALLTLSGCSSSTRSSDVAPDTTSVVEVTTSTSTTTTVAPSSDVLVSFPDAASVARWANVDDSVMGGVSASRSTWTTDGGVGALAFTGVLSTERNGGFSSTLGPIDRTMGARAAGARALKVEASGDGRTYLLQLRAGADSAQRWIARFTPPTSAGVPAHSTIAIDAFESVSQFLRPITPAGPLDPSTITQLGIYVLDGQVGEFRLVLTAVTAVK